MEFTIQEIKEAYSKLKAYIYYDNAEVLMREHLVEFETNLSKDINEFFSFHRNSTYAPFLKEGQKLTFDLKLEIITERLNDYHNEPDFFNSIIEKKINTIFFPKKFSNDESDLKKIISNKRIKQQYKLERITAFIDAPIEIHLLSVLWIMRSGVNLDAKLDDGCLGNRLLLNKDKSAVVKGSGLFKPYFKQYQKWRDNSVLVAQELISKDKNVLFLNLDIKDYFHSVRIPISYFKSKSKKQNSLNEILLKVHLKYTKSISNTYKVPNDFYDDLEKDNDGNLQEFVLPIGLLSSYVLANEYLLRFDKIMTEKYKPAYYSRYVDDILIVLSDPNPESIHEDTNSDIKFSFEKYKNFIEKKKKKFYEINFEENELDDIELYILNNFYPIINLVQSPFDEKGKKRIFIINGYESLFCQSDKIILHYFDSDESDLVIDKLKKELDEKTSEFRDLPSDNEGLVDFESNAYHLNYDGHEGKIRTLKDYKENRYGLTVYLTNKIFVALRKENLISEKEKNQILKFFLGENCLHFYRLWERILTLFLVNKQPKAYVDFYCHCLEQINKLHDNLGNEFIGDTQVNYNDVRNTLRRYLDCVHQLVLSLNPKFIENVKDVQRHFEFKVNGVLGLIPLFPTYDSNTWVTRYRKTNMMRHQYVITPLLNYTLESKKNKIDLTDSNYNFNQFNIDYDLIKNSPRTLRFWECCIAIFHEKLSNFKFENLKLSKEGDFFTDFLNSDFVNSNTDDDLDKIEKIYLDEAYDLYLQANEYHEFLYESNYDLKRQFFIHKNICNDSDDIPFLRELNVNSDNGLRVNKPLISFANTEVKESNILNSLLKSPNLSSDRYQKLALILKKARKEKSDILIFPESFIPINLLSTLAKYAQQNQTLLITGLEHIVVENTAFNFVVSILPFERNGIKDATVVFRLKNNYAPDEVKLIIENHLFVPKPLVPRMDVFNWKNIYFSVAYCFEMANISYRSQLKGKIDLLIGIEFNKDTNYFSNIVESTTRDLHCYVAQVNTSHFGDSRLSRPSISAKKDLLRLKGGLNDTILVSSIDIEGLRSFQRKKINILDDSKEFKPLPPDFKLDDVLKRIQNKKITDGI